MESLELRRLLSAAADVTGLTALRLDSRFASIDGSGVGIAVLDTGLFASHPDIVGNFVGYYDAVRDGANTSLPGTTNPAAASDNDGHGSHVSGTAASTNPEIGVATAADLVGVRVLTDDGERFPRHDPLAAGLEWVLNNRERFNIRVVNMSLGTFQNINRVPAATEISRLIDRLERVGVTVVTANGNAYGDFAAPGAAVPAVYSTLGVVSTWEDAGVGDRLPLRLGSSNGTFFDASPAGDQIAAYSQRAGLANQIAAPGTTIFSTWNGAGGQLYNTILGTSMASPFVAGTVALMQDAAFTFGGRYLTTDEVVTIIRDTGDLITDTQNPNTFYATSLSGARTDLPETGLTFPRVNVLRAVERTVLTVTGSEIVAQPPAVETNATIATATTFPLLNGTQNFSVDASIGADGASVIGATDIDLYRIDLEVESFINAVLDPISGGTAFDPILRLFDASGNLLTFADDTEVSLYPQLFTESPLPAGAYYLGVSGIGNAAYNISTGQGAAAGEQGDYRLTLFADNPDPNGVFTGAVDVDLTDPDAFINDTTSLLSNLQLSALGSDPNPVDLDSPRTTVGSTDVDFFRVVAPDDGMLNIQTRSASVFVDSVDTYLAAFSADQALLGFNDDAPGLGTDSSLSILVEAGKTYFIAVTTFGNRNFDPVNPYGRSSDNPETGTTEVYFTFDNDDSNGTLLLARPVNLGQRVDDAIGSDAGQPLTGTPTNGGHKDVDFYDLTTGTTGYLGVRIDALTDGFIADASVWRLSTDDLSVLQSARATGSSMTILLPVEAAESVAASVTGLGNGDHAWFALGSGSGGLTGNYTFITSAATLTSVLAVIDDRIGAAVSTIGTNQIIDAQIGQDTSAAQSASASTTTFFHADPTADRDLYRFVAPSNMRLQIATNTSAERSVDSFLAVYSPQGELLEFNDNAGPSTLSSLITVDLVAGQEIFISVAAAGALAAQGNPLTDLTYPGGNSSGPYRLLLTDVSVDPAISVADAAPTAEGQDMVFTITLNQPLTSALTVNVTASPGSASADDFAPVSTQVIFAPGETQKSVSVPVLTDFVSEPSETITLTISAQGVNISDAAAVGQIIDVAPPAGPNFIATGFRREPGPLLLPGRRYDAIVTVQNAGNERSRANVTVDLYASTDDTVDEGDILLSTSTARLTLSPGRSSNRRLRFAAPLLESDRNVRLIAVVSSSAQETSPSDQLASSGTTTIQRAFVDPAATALTAPRTLRPGRSVTLTLTTRNQGNITLTQMYSAVVNIVDSSNQVVATTTVSVMLRTAAGRSERDRLRIAIPADLAPGDYTFTTTLVPPGTFSESTIDNNSAQTTRVSTVRSPR